MKRTHVTVQHYSGVEIETSYSESNAFWLHYFVSYGFKLKYGSVCKQAS